MTALAVARYLLADAVRSQRVLLPVVLQVAVLAVLFGGDPGRLPEPWGASVLTLYPVAAWLALTYWHTSPPGRRARPSGCSAHGRGSGASAGPCSSGRSW
ncbi:hypothetical protein GCM10023215_38020 [Pseudonocardia yuanmonensis]|uniref:Uncharacterized protein n=1 Tax=Pseudonocardia yuanmonensis TaxID=1095914 RepID=A0ABP8WXM6_9PSEU